MNSKQNYILVVEDSVDIREQIRYLYELEGYPVKTAEDGQKALQLLRESSALPSVILLDMMMPTMDGAQFRKEQTNEPRLAAIPVLIMTADANADLKAAQVGARGYLRKPIDVETLIKVAQKYCS